ncbi:MAG TPA: hypothetical protein VIW67_13215 [Terriglobales bacterium]
MYIVDLLTFHVENLTPGVTWVSTYSSPSWSPRGDQLAFEKFGNAGERHQVVTMVLATKSVDILTDGWFPSWSPDGTKIAFVEANGVSVYTFDVRSRERRLVWNSLLGSLLNDEIIAAPVWAPSSLGILLNKTSGIKGDGREIHYLDFSSGSASRITYNSAFEVVEWVPEQRTDEPAPQAGKVGKEMQAESIW